MVDPEGYSLVTKPMNNCLMTVAIFVAILGAGVAVGYFLFRGHP